MKKLILLGISLLVGILAIGQGIVKPISLHNPLRITNHYGVIADSAKIKIVSVTNGTHPHLIYNISNRLRVDSYYGTDISGVNSITLSVGSFTAVLTDTALDVPAISVNGGPAISHLRNITTANLTRINVSRLHIIPQSSAPSTPTAGDIYYDSDDNKFYGYNGSTWTALF